MNNVLMIKHTLLHILEATLSTTRVQARTLWHTVASRVLAADSIPVAPELPLARFCTCNKNHRSNENKSILSCMK